MINLSSIEYKTYSQIVENHLKKHESWDEIKMLSQPTIEDLQNLLDANAMITGCTITVEDWFDVVEHVKHNKECEVTITLVPPSIIPASVPSGQQFSVDNSPGSAWTSYKKKLFENHFEQSTVDMIEQSSINILNKLSLNTTNSEPVKGLVIGNVQSGKTANMAALMAMAADKGWNMFIVLSGTIENLRIQTQDRLLRDLTAATNVSWIPIDNVDNSISSPYHLSKLQLDATQNKRYLMVCLKNSTRLKNLLTWLQGDLRNRSKLKILFIDDEADQAGVNAVSKIKPSKDDPNEIERTAINKNIVALLTNKNSDNKIVKVQYQALNYVAYTATPYANILNESPGPTSIYPKNFVASLGSSNIYFGPQQIFGLESSSYDGLNIVNKVTDVDYEMINKIHKRESLAVPKSFEDALLWFYCCLAIRRFRGSHKPVTMLIHTHSAQKCHDAIADLIQHWFKQFDGISFLKACEKVFDEQISNFTLEDLKSGYPNYGLIDEVQDYPSFKDISNILLNVFNNKLNRILISEEGDPKFSQGVHLCIDNCSYNYTGNDNEHIRLIYPKKDLDFAPGFIVVGGATLSRGLTLEGLVSTYFLRTVKMADALMQMGRWFGYRVGYELLQRIWMRDECKEKFKFLSEMDFELRQKMKYMEEKNLNPSLVGISIMQYASKKIEITAKNKQKAAVVIDMEFSGLATQTTMFYSDENVLLENYNTTEQFISGLGKEDDNSNYVSSDGCLLWKNVENNKVVDYIKNMKFPKGDSNFFDVRLFDNWFADLASNGKLKDWNVVVSGVSNNPTVDMAGRKIYTVTRSKKKQENDDGVIRIGALRAPKDLYADIDLTNSNLTGAEKQQINQGFTSEYQKIRNMCGLDKTCLLIIYVIDKDSVPKNQSSKTREPLNTKNDVIGLTVVIPGDDEQNDNSRIHVGVDLNLGSLDKEEEEDEDAGN